MSAPPATAPSLADAFRAPRAAGVAGVLFSVLFVTSILLLRRQPPEAAGPAELKAFYTHGDGRYLNLIGLYVAPFAGIAFLWFLAVTRSQIGHAADRFFDTVFLGSGALFVAMLFAAAAAAGALSAAVRFEDVGAPASSEVDVARALAYSLLFTFAVKAAGVFMMVTSTIAYKTRRLPRGLVYVSWALAVVILFSVSFYELLILVFPFWVAAISVVVLVVGDPAAPQPTGEAR